MKIVILILKILAGIMLIIFGANKLFPFMPSPEMEGMAAEFMKALNDSGYLMQLVGLVEILTGLAMITNKFLPLMLVVMAPVSVNMLAFHLFMEPASTGPAAFIFLVNFYLIYINRAEYDALLKA
ncbi:MAG: DoxX family membrane protein [Bacteroidales bacterium]|nr:DoxX family membrane protein [Bacteroidales bacterium]